MSAELPKIRIVSHPLCPYAQRCRLLLLRKGLEMDLEFEMVYVDLADIPEWFLHLSPEGRMPVVSVGEGTRFYSSTAICEFFDEAVPGRLMPEGAMDRLRHRVIIAEADRLLEILKEVFLAKSEDAMECTLERLFQALRKLEAAMASGTGYFDHGVRLSMADVAFAPFFSLALFYPWLAEREEWRVGTETDSVGEVFANGRRCIGFEVQELSRRVCALFRLDGERISAACRYSFTDGGDVGACVVDKQKSRKTWEIEKPLDRGDANV